MCCLSLAVNASLTHMSWMGVAAVAIILPVRVPPVTKAISRHSTMSLSVLHVTGMKTGAGWKSTIWPLGFLNALPAISIKDLPVIMRESAQPAMQ
jgi:hypothetical protein